MRIGQLIPSLLLTGAVQVLVAQPVWAQVTQVTGVRLDETPNGLAVILETADGTSPQVVTSSFDQTLLIDLIGAQLRLAEGEFRQDNPAFGITSVTVKRLYENSVRVTVTGVQEVPTAEVQQSDRGLVVSLTTAADTTATQPTPVPEAPDAETEPGSDETQPIQPDSEQTDIEVVVTATRTAEEITKVPRSVTVITREEIEQQTRLTRNLGDILANTVPGFAPPTNRTNTFGQTLRGRNISVLIDGIPQNTNIQSIPAQLTSIDPSAIERIEVVRGPSAIYGGQATGGIVNIITRRSTENRLTSTTDVGLNTSLTNSEESFGYNLQHSISGKEGQFDYTASFSIATTGAFYDAEGDRIANFAGGEDSLILNGLLKLGVELDSQQRLQLSFNHYDRQQDTDFISDPEIDNIPGIQKARALEVPEGIRVIGAKDESFLRTTIASLNYTHQNLLGSAVQAQAYYRNYSFGGGTPTDDRGGFFDFIYTSPGESEQLGGRLQIDTPFNSEKTLSLLWGVDYLRERSSQSFDIFDPVEFDGSGGLVYRKTDELTFVPAYKLNQLGLFAQLQWDVSDRVRLTGGVRHERIGLSVDDYTTAVGNRDIKGGDRDFNATVFNAGAVFNVTEEVSLFANFAQAFSVPDLGRVLRLPPAGFVSVEDSIRLTEPQKVDNYEIGIRGQWRSVQASLSAFYNFSDLGSTFRAIPGGGPLETIRAPQRVYGLEAAVDVQPGDRWQIGGTASYLEGENDADDDGEYLALNSITIPPLKLTAYVQHETLPGWLNRLQLLYSGNRDRAFDDGVDSGKISSYVTVDYISSIRLGKGTLSIGVQNLFNNQYFPVYSQYFAPFFDSSNYAGQGRTLSVGYQIVW
ncbi:TonB-dependent receptor domain-containing protein [Coleofasciculus sp. H7-2]|uniref:TonB-dependent receptor domain-containing protein n=1 Tax=Coleofasciculus sp. H7-2 TaxID=3351545 RepID=UPI00366F907B